MDGEPVGENLEWIMHSQELHEALKVLPAGRARSLAYTKLDELVMWASQAARGAGSRSLEGLTRE